MVFLKASSFWGVVMRYQRYQRSKSPVRMFLCKPDNRKWLIVTGGLLAVIITLSVILAVTLSGRASGASGVRDPANLRQAVDSIDGIPLFTAYIPEDSPGRPGVLRTVESITIHETANTSEGADAEAHSDYLSTTSDEVSWHYTVDDHQIYQHLPDNEEAWHSGDREGNHSSIGIPSMHSRNFPFSCGFLSTVAVECSVLNFSLCSFE